MAMSASIQVMARSVVLGLHFLVCLFPLNTQLVCMCVLVAQLCPVFCYSMYTPWVEVILGPEILIHITDLDLPFST